jgi:hypothetical protein
MMVFVYHKIKYITLFIFSPNHVLNNSLPNIFIEYCLDITMKYGISSDTVGY